MLYGPGRGVRFNGDRLDVILCAIGFLIFSIYPVQYITKTLSARTVP